jgi:uncharacterized membrane protein (UPF0182 family)
MKFRGISFKHKGLIFVFGVIFIAVLLFGALSGYIIDLQWFKELGYTEVFFKKVITQIKFFVPSLIIMFSVFYIYMRSMNAYSKKNTGLFVSEGENKWRNKIFIIVSSLLSVVFSVAFVSEVWYDFLIFINKTPFDLKDPIFGYDISFFVFTLPFLKKLYGFLLGIIIVFAVITVVFNAIIFITPRKTKEDFDDIMSFKGVNRSNYKDILKAGGKQLSFLGGIFFLVMALGFFLRMFDLLYSSRGMAFGGGYTDIHISLPFYYLYIGLSIIIGLSFMISSKGINLKIIVFGPLALILATLVSGIVGAAVQNLIVTPNELAKEEKYLQFNIDYTNYAYGLQDVEVKQFSVAQDLIREDIEENSITINNIPVNDYKPAKDIYNQIQGLKNYYYFYDMDIDRYMINGEYRQVFISARELQSGNIPKQESGGTSWINRYLKYTHGYGVAMSPVNEVTPSGQPRLFIKDLPVISETDIKVERPQLYYGELAKEFAIVNTREKEFDYPSSSGNVETVYEGTGGIPLTFSNRIMLALTQGKMNFILSQDISSKSKILMHREIIERVKKIAPFLAYDEDPYIVVSEGNLYWIIDAYTISNRYPYSESINEGSDINYIRNSVKIIIDAYNGTTDFYIADDKDPQIITYGKVFKTLFKPLSEMPQDLRAHLRYPQMLFDIQTDIYSRYHIKNAREFYNKSDVWDIATQIYGPSGASSESEFVESSYLIMKLPDSDKEEFILMVPYTPQRKNNMISWFAVKNDGENYGQLKLYTFPSGKIVEGPMQIEGIISQDVAIGNAINLLQSGGNSQVIRGNMLIIPIEDSILYVEPIYLRASNASALPELKKVIVFYKNKVVMEDSLEMSLARIFPPAAEEGPVKPVKPKPDVSLTPSEDADTMAELIELANSTFGEALEAQKEGNWALYGEKLNELSGILEKLNEIK